MGLSAGLSSSQNASNQTQQTTGPVAFGAVDIEASPPPTPAAAAQPWLWYVLAGLGGVLVTVLLLRKS